MARLNSRAKAEPLPIGARLSPFSKLVLITFPDDLFPWTPEPKIVSIGSKPLTRRRSRSRRRTSLMRVRLENLRITIWTDCNLELH